MMKKICLVLFVLFSFIYVSNAQVETRYLRGNESVIGMRKPISQNNAIIRMPSFDLDHAQNERNKSEDNSFSGPFCFGKGFDVSYTLSDGQWEKVEGGRLWTMSVQSEGAYSLNFVFESFYLPEGADMYIENGEGSVVYGPVKAKDIGKDGFFLTDIIEGDCVRIYLFEPDDAKNKSTLTIKRVIHGLQKVSEVYEKAKTRSNGYSPYVACYNNNEYEKESDAVALVLLANGTEMCSGALVMSTDYSFAPYFLTAFRLVDGNRDNVLSDSEIYGAEHCMFKFRYKYLVCDNMTLATSYSYNGAEFKSAWANTQYALLKLTGNLKQNPKLTWLGWNRGSSYPSSGACLFHFDLSEMRISIDNNQLGGYGSYFLGNYGWETDFDEGIGYFGMPGAPLLDGNKRIVGTAFGGYNHVSPWLNVNADFGKFHLSWTGGGTNSTRISNWLDPNNTGQTTMDSYRSIIISGPSNVISSSIYSILNLPSGMSVSWSLSDSYYNQNGLQQNTPSTNQCTITKHSGHSMSSAVLTANIKKNGTTICTVTKLISTGNGMDGTYYNGITTKQIDLPNPLYVLPGTSVTINSQNLIGASVSQNGGNATPTSWQFNSSSGILIVGMPSTVGNTVVVKVICSGGTIYNLPITTIASDSGQLMLSRADNTIEVSFDVHDSNAWSLEVSNAITGEKVYSKKEIVSCHNFNTEGWRPGIYIVKATKGKDCLEKKILIK